MSDLYQAVTDRIVTALEQGAPPWVRPWSTLPEAIPMNAQSRRPYRGVNFALLSLEAASHGYDVNRWLTYRQAAELGAQVRRGAHGTTVVFWQLRKVAATAEAFPDEADPPSLPDKVYPLLRAYTVFNVAQVDDLPATYTAVGQVELGARGEGRGAAADVRRHRAPRRHQGLLQPRCRRDPAAAPRGVRRSGRLLQRGTARAHPLDRPCEPLQPAAGRPFRRCRLRRGGADRRDGGRVPVRPLPARRRAPPRVSYLASWLKVLRADKRAIFAAASAAQRAADYVLRLANPIPDGAIALAA